jgi:hypothetical protein
MGLKRTAVYCGDRCRKRAYYTRNKERLLPTYVKYRKRVEKDAETRRRDLVRNQAWRAVKAGKLTPEPCLFCDAERVDAHHHDYGQPLVVTWLCRRHHRRVHESQDRLAA